jgi:hypothetical protein
MCRVNRDERSIDQPDQFMIKGARNHLFLWFYVQLLHGGIA